MSFQTILKVDLMRALRFSSLGDLGSLKLMDLPEPEAAAGEALIQVHAAGLNPSDVKNVLGRFPYTTLPRTPGRDFAGTVVAGPSEWVGRDVWGTAPDVGFTRDGSHADFMTLPTAALVEKPKGLSFAQAASCGVPYITAWDALERSGVAAGTRVVVIGAGGSVGGAALAMAKARGADAIAAVRKPQQADLLAREGFRTMLLESEVAFEQAMREAFPGGAEAVFDTTGFWLPAAIKVLAPFGRIAVIAAPVDGHVRVPVLDLYRKGGSIAGVNSLLHNVAATSRIIARITTEFESGRLAPPKQPAENAFDAAIASYEAVNAGATDKIVFKMTGNS